MKKVLLASSVLALSAGFASAEIKFSGSAVMGVGDNGIDDPRSILETYLTASASGETDAGLSFGFETTIATYDTDGGLNDDGTSAFISGAFGKLSMGSVAEADEVATLPDIGGLSGLGVDNIAEAFTGDSAGRETHDVNYTYSGGPLTFGASAHIGAAGEGDGYAVGVKYSFGDAYVGIGYNDDNVSAAAGTVVSLYGGGTFGAVSVKAMWSEWDPDAAGDKLNAYGVHMDYTVDALTISAQYSANDLENLAGNGHEAFGLGAAYDLGGGAKVVGGVANVTNNDLDDDTVWEMGLSFTF
ncbi:porin [Tabrizicola sp. YIM 78059]|uniref:porin n=1 Tax=Tabrizicola sp. YIM 78059 TaxID=2529861 RepID=UPI0010AB4576|nr:porin [Tabrizicola sp. YIM 78059]